MIKIEVTGSVQEAANDLYHLTRLMAAGQAVVNAQNAQSAPPVAVSVASDPALEEPKPDPKPKRTTKAKDASVEKTPEPETLSADPIVENVEEEQSTESMSDEDVAATLDEPRIKTPDELKAYALKAAGAIGYKPVQTLIGKYAPADDPKVSKIPQDKWAAFVADMEAELKKAGK